MRWTILMVKWWVNEILLCSEHGIRAVSCISREYLVDKAISCDYLQSGTRLILECSSGREVAIAALPPFLEYFMMRYDCISMWYCTDVCDSSKRENKFLSYAWQKHVEAWSYARFTLADPMPRLGSDVVGGNSGRNHPTTRRHTIHIGRMARNVSIRVGWYEGVVQYCTTPWLVRWKSLIYYNSQLRCTRSAPDRPAASGNIKHV